MIIPLHSSHVSWRIYDLCLKSYDAFPHKEVPFGISFILLSILGVKSVKMKGGRPTAEFGPPGRPRVIQSKRNLLSRWDGPTLSADTVGRYSWKLTMLTRCCGTQPTVSDVNVCRQKWQSIYGLTLSAVNVNLRVTCLTVYTTVPQPLSNDSMYYEPGDVTLEFAMTMFSLTRCIHVPQ